MIVGAPTSRPECSTSEPWTASTIANSLGGHLALVVQKADAEDDRRYMVGRMR
jgi:hypothetical protein